jgi:hypothetical protein
MTVWIRATGGLVPLEADSYAAEAELQSFIAQHPEVLAGAVADDEQAAPWLLITQELDIVMSEGADRVVWSLDHLFVDADGVPTLIEVKRSSDPRWRREVVGQMLDYAASFRASWSAERLEQTWRNRCSDPDTILDGFLELTSFDGTEAFWDAVETNIRANRLRLVFVADRLSSPVVRIIEYLNEQMATTEVIGIEVRPYRNPGDPTFVAYVPTVRGRTTSTETKSARPRLTWDDLARVLLERHGPEQLAAVQLLKERSEAAGAFSSFGTDQRNPRLFINLRGTPNGRTFWPLAVNPRHGTVALQLRWLAKHPAFAEEAVRREFVDRCRDAIGHEIDAPRLDGFPTFPVAALTSERTIDDLVGVMTWLRALAEVAETGTPAAG